MASMKDFASGNFLKADEVDAMVDKGIQPIATIKNEAVVVKNTFTDPRTGQNIESERAEVEVVMPDGEEKTVGLNKTSVRNLVKAWGEDSASWVNKKIRFKTGVTQKGLALYAYPVEAPASPASASGTVEVKQVQLNADGALDGVPSADGRVKIQIVKDGLGSAVVPFEGKAFNFVKGSIHSLTEKDAQFLINNGFATKLIAIDLTG